MSRLRKTVVPFRWTIFAPSFTSGTAGTVNVATYLQNPEGKTITYSVVGTLPSGCTFAGSTLSYDGVGAANALQVTFRAVSGSFTVDSAVTTVAITAVVQPNRAPVWGTVPTQAATQGTQYTASIASYATDPDGDLMTFGRTGTASDTAPASITVNSAGLLTVPSTVAAGSYQIEVYADDGKSAPLTDWQTRINGSGVIWYHNFELASEVNQFRRDAGIGGNDPNNLGDGNTRHVATDGFAGGGCLEINIPVGSPVNSNWIRPLNALTGATNGRGVDDPGAAGTITRYAWNVTQGTDYVGKWKDGYYAHADYWSHPTRGVPGGWGHDGTEFWLQFRFKVPASRFNSANTGIEGKFAALMITGNGTSHITPNQELCLQSTFNPVLRSYTNFGNRSNSLLYTDQYNQTGSRQPAILTTRSAKQCLTSSPQDCTNCICIPTDEWVTFLLHVKPGHDGGGGDQPPASAFTDPTKADTTYEWFMCRTAIGETTYTPIYSRADWVWSYGEFDSTPYGFNAFKPWGYMNNGGTPVGAAVAWTHRYTQMIFSKNYIPPPAA